MATPSQPFSPQELKDGLLTFENGVNHGIAPELVPRNQLFEAVNVSVRGDFAGPRPYFIKRYLDYTGDAAMEARCNSGWVQGGCYFKPDTGPEALMLSIAGRLYQFTIGIDRAQVTDVTKTFPQSATATQAWLWQAEKWVIWNDGVSNPVFYDPLGGGGRSNYTISAAFTTYNTALFVIPAIGATVVVTVNDATNILVGDIISVLGRGRMSVQSIAGANITMLNIDATPLGQDVPVPGLPHGAPPGVPTGTDNLSWVHAGTQLPPGRMGTYGLGRNWVCLVDGKQFVASDAVGGSSGHIGHNYRDAVLYITENLYLAGGGNFAVPGTYGDIHAMRFAATLDASLGQGPLQVFTRNNVFSCVAPTNRLAWQDVTNPILTESLIAGGATGQDSTIPVNGDTLMRSIDGLRSLILARREFATWGNTPISHEVDPTLDEDSPDLLPWASAIVFDNRFLLTTGGVLGPHGPYFRGIVPLNFDPISGLRGKQPAVYDSRLWTGLNIYKLFVGSFGGVERAFAFCFNPVEDKLELYEILPSVNPAIADNTTTRVTWRMESGTLDFGEKDPRTRHYKKLQASEIFVDELKGSVDFFAWWKPDQWPCWVPWAKWSECADMRGDNAQPQFRPRMGLPEPSALWCDPITNRPLREGYTFRIALEITGHCIFKGAKFTAVTAPEPKIAPPTCSAICPPS